MGLDDIKTASDNKLNLCQIQKATKTCDMFVYRYDSDDIMCYNNRSYIIKYKLLL